MRFLCLGDSLTAGYPGYDPSHDGISQGYGNYNSQYEYWLKRECLEFIKKKGNGLSNEIVDGLLFINKGIPGELTRDLLGRIHINLVNHLPKPEYSIIIGGTNDLGWGINNSEIFENIKKLHSISRKSGIVSIGSTIPPIKMEQSSGDYHGRKINLNEILREYYQKNNIPFADLYNGMMDEGGNLRREYSYVDGLHFSVEGYKKMGLVIFKDAIKKIIDLY